MSYSHLQTTTGQPVAAGAAGSSRFESTDRSDLSRQRQLAVDDDAKVTGCVLHFYAWRQNAHVWDVELGELLTWTQPHNQRWPAARAPKLNAKQVHFSSWNAYDTFTYTVISQQLQPYRLLAIANDPVRFEARPESYTSYTCRRVDQVREARALGACPPPPKKKNQEK